MFPDRLCMVSPRFASRLPGSQSASSRSWSSAAFILVAAGALALSTSGCSSKKYVRSQVAPVVQQTNDLDAKTSADHRTITDTDERAQSGINGAMGAANTADQHAQAAGQGADSANHSAQDAYNRVDSLTGTVANLDNYKPVADVSVTFATAKYVLTPSDKKKLDALADTATSTRGCILEVTGGTDSVGGADYNYKLSQQRADAVANYLQTAHNIAPHRFYLVGIGKDQQIASDKTAAGRAKNRRVQVRVLSNAGTDTATPATPSGGSGL